MVDLREDVVQRRMIPENGGGLAVQRLDDARVGRAKALGRPRKIRGAPEQTEMQFITVPCDGRQIDSAAMGCSWLGGLRQGLERVLRADQLEVIGIEVEEAAVVHACAMYPNRNPAEVDKGPRTVGLLAVPV